MNSQVSVIIPTYNSEKYIARAIESVLQQTYPNVEVIVVDDASHDTTTEIVQRYCSDRLKLIINDRNQGPSYTRNRGIEIAQGEWIALLDSDDWYARDRLEKLLQVARTENADFVVDDLYLTIESAENPWGTRFYEKGLFGSRQIRINTITQINAVDFIDLDLGVVKPLIRRGFLTQHDLKFEESLRYGEDFLLFLKSLLNKAIFIIVPTPYYFYCSHPNNLTMDYLKCQQQMYNTTLDILQEEFIQNNSKLVSSLSTRLKKIDINLKISWSFARVVSLLKQGKILTLTNEIIKDSNLLLLAGLHILRNLQFRLKPLLSKIYLKAKTFNQTYS